MIEHRIRSRGTRCLTLLSFHVRGFVLVGNNNNSNNNNISGFVASVTCGFSAHHRDQLLNPTFLSSMGLYMFKQGG